MDPRLIMGGTSIAQAILGGIGGPSDETLTRRQGKEQLLGMRGQDILNPNEAMQGEYLAMVPFAREWGAKFDKKFGRNSGSGFKAIMQALQGGMRQTRNRAMELNATTKANRDLSIAQTLAGYDEEE